MLLLATALLVVFASVGQTFAASAGVMACKSSQLQVIVQTQGENTTARIDTVVRNTGQRCSVAALAKLTITRHGSRAVISGNPLSHRFSGVLRHGRTTVTRADWMNWCGGRLGLRVRALFAMHTTRASFHVIPLCLQPTEKSRLVLIK